jgi:hypothetical protein
MSVCARFLLLVAACWNACHASEVTYVDGVYNRSSTIFAFLKLHKVGSDTVRLAIYYSVGARNAYAEHDGLSPTRANAGHVCGLLELTVGRFLPRLSSPATTEPEPRRMSGSGLPLVSSLYVNSVPSSYRIIFTVMFREPSERLISALNMAGHMKEEWHWPKDQCAGVSEENVQRLLTIHNERNPDGNRHLFVSPHPYSEVFQVGIDGTGLERAVAILERDWVVGVTDRMDDYYELLSRIFRLDARASAAYASRQAIKAAPESGHAHHAKPYCTLSLLNKQTQRFLHNITGTDNAIYAEVVQIFLRQFDQDPRKLPQRRIADAHKECATAPTKTNGQGWQSDGTFLAAPQNRSLPSPGPVLTAGDNEGGGAARALGRALGPSVL